MVTRNLPEPGRSSPFPGPRIAPAPIRCALTPAHATRNPSSQPPANHRPVQQPINAEWRRLSYLACPSASRHECVLQRSQRRSQRANLPSLYEPCGRGRTGRAGRCRRSRVSPAGSVCGPGKIARRRAPVWLPRCPPASGPLAQQLRRCRGQPQPDRDRRGMAVRCRGVRIVTASSYALPPGACPAPCFRGHDSCGISRRMASHPRNPAAATSPKWPCPGRL